MKTLYMITREDCPYCMEAEKNLHRIMENSPYLCCVRLKILRDVGDPAGEWDHYYTPAFFWDKEKLSEGEYTEEALRRILEKVYQFEIQG